MAGCIAADREVVGFSPALGPPALAAVVLKADDAVAVWGRTPAERVAAAIAHLDAGEIAPARAELTAASSGQPNRSSDFLLRQLDAPLESLFPDASFAIPVKKGQTLSTIAANYLGDPLFRFGLARLNGIERPSSLREGQILRIPRTDRAVATFAAEERVRVWSEIQAMLSSGQYSAAVALAERTSFEPKESQAAALAAAYHELASKSGDATKLRLLRRTAELYLLASEPDQAIAALNRAAPSPEIAALKSLSVRRAAEFHAERGRTLLARYDFREAQSELDLALQLLRNGADEPERVELLSLLQQAQTGQRDSQIKVGYLQKLVSFVRWPATTGSETPASIDICIVGDGFGEILASQAVHHSLAGRTIHVNRERDPAAVTHCHAVFITGSKGESTKWLDAASALPILTITDVGVQGGMIELIRDGQQLRFSIDNDKAARRNLIISSNLLSIASPYRRNGAPELSAD